MQVLVFSKNKNLKNRLNINTKGNSFKTIFLPLNKMRKHLRDITAPTLVYIDISGIEENLKRNINYLAKKEYIYFGVIDLKGKITDTAELFIKGAVDYLGKTTNNEAFCQKRFKRVTNYLKKYRIDYREDLQQNSNYPDESRYNIAPQGWKDIRSGSEYAFSVMFIELDKKAEMEKKYGKNNLQRALNTFKAYVERNITPFDGRIWIWSGFGGIILFPFNAVECRSVTSCFRIKLFKHIHDVEESLFPGFISFRVCLILGNIIYNKIDTGNLISDIINSIFHLGNKFTEQDDFIITKEIYEFTPKPLKKYFMPAGTFEGRKLFRMRLPVLYE